MALENVITYLVLDVIDHDQTQGVVKAIALDSKTRYVQATIVQHGTDYDVDPNAVVTLTVLRPDNVGVQITGSVVDVDNADRTGTIKGVYAELSQAALAKSGTLRAQFKLTSGEQILRTEIFQIKNGIALDGETAEWADQYEGYNLDEVMEAVNTAVATVEGMESDVSDLKADLPQISGWSGIGSSFSKGNYTSSGPNTDPTRVYMVIQNVGKGSKIIFDPTKVRINYYYITSTTNYAYLYTPSFWDISGEVTLTYIDDGVVFIVARDANSSSARISDNIPLVNSAIKIYNIKKNSLSKETLYQTLCNTQGKVAIPGSFIKGSYTNSGPNTDPTRIYMIVDNLNSGSYVEFDASRVSLNYYYIKSKTDFTKLYSPNAWDTSGKIVFSQSGKGNTIFIVAKDANNSSSMIGDHPELLNNAITIFANEIVPRKVNWVAYGDSITNGSYSTSDGQTKNDMYHGYAYRIAKVLCSDKIDNFYNCGVRGIGWINTGNNGETFDDMLALFTGDKSTIQLVTIMLGINDYLSNETIGDENAAEKDGTISGNIRYGIRWISENYPNAKIVAISPLNSMHHGTAATGWSRNTRLNLPGSLQDVCDMIAYWCNIYNVTYINEISESFLNNYNMSTYLKDNLHPTDEGQWMLARELSRKIFV